jgi:hypothetical protein
MTNPKEIQAAKDGKVPADLLPFEHLAAAARVLQTGAVKYGRRNWLVDKIKASTYVGAIFRHAMLEWSTGTNEVEDTGEHPLAHVIACCLVVMDAEKYGTLIDDRFSAESLSENRTFNKDEIWERHNADYNGEGTTCAEGCGDSAAQLEYDDAGHAGDGGSYYSIGAIVPCDGLGEGRYHDLRPRGCLR